MNVEGAAILGIFFVAIVFSFFTAVFHALGIIWATPAALLCARVANEKGLDNRSYIIRGALYSALNFWLWFYFMKRMQGEDISDSLIRIFFIFLFFNWLFVSVFYSFTWAEIISVRSHDGQQIVVAMWMLRVCGAVSAVAWVVSLVRLVKAPYYKYSYQAPNHDEQATTSQLRSVYVLPCVFALALTVIPNVIMLTVAGLEY